MLNSIARVVENFKQSWSREIEDQAILDACAEARHRWRERDLGPITTVRMFLLQILWGEKHGLQITWPAWPAWTSPAARIAKPGRGCR